MIKFKLNLMVKPKLNLMAKNYIYIYLMVKCNLLNLMAKFSIEI
jgi:hypothetical protein